MVSTTSHAKQEKYIPSTELTENGHQIYSSYLAPTLGWQLRRAICALHVGPEGFCFGQTYTE